VEALFAGPADAVQIMLDRCRFGPRDARVENIKVIQEGGVAPGGFTVKPTK